MVHNYEENKRKQLEKEEIEIWRSIGVKDRLRLI